MEKTLGQSRAGSVTGFTRLCEAVNPALHPQQGGGAPPRPGGGRDPCLLLLTELASLITSKKSLSATVRMGDSKINVTTLYTALKIRCSHAT